MMPLVSVVVVSYNHARFLQECLNSILNQSYSNWELIVADDASKDDSVAIYEDWLQKNNLQAKKNYHKANVGLCRTLNECIRLCAGKYVKLIAADDFLDIHFLRESVSALEKAGDDYAMSYGVIAGVDEHSIKEENIVLPVESSSHENGLVFEALLSGNFMPAPTFLIKREVYNVIGDYDENILIEDWEFSLRLARQYKIKFVPTALCYYRRHQHNISSAGDKIARAEWEIIKKYEGDGRYSDSVKEYVKKIYSLRSHEYVRKQYLQYKYRNRIVAFCIKHHVSHLMFRVLNKVFNL